MMSNLKTLEPKEAFKKHLIDYLVNRQLDLIKSTIQLLCFFMISAWLIIAGCLFKESGVIGQTLHTVFIVEIILFVVFSYFLLRDFFALLAVNRQIITTIEHG
ncbi:MAG: hypothetical protein A3E87_02845 [Gammaproteobacteria bacterium RIFCSPHIGHO2_12_FULL_35_23]|nr:MAG: hypothetical protein A3E87_02845 [Gammaproteobacteria bacterium RIFCSPHIGHO2_12_FULL_35_23]